MNDNMLRKGMVFAVIALFIGVAVAPSITAIDLERNSFLMEPSIFKPNNELVEIRVQLFKLVGNEEYTVILPKQKALELDNLLNNIESKLDAAETREEAVTIIKDAIVSLNEYGLLPSHMSISEIQELVTTNYYDPSTQDLGTVDKDILINLENLETQEEKIAILNGAIKSLYDEIGLQSSDMKLLKNLYCRNQGNDESGIYNLLCLVATHVDRSFTYDFSIPLIIAGYILGFIGELFNFHEGPVLEMIFLLWFFFVALLDIYNQEKLFHLLCLVGIDENAIGTPFYSLGLLGLRSDTVGSDGVEFTGFTGIKITTDWNNDDRWLYESYFLGSALSVSKPRFFEEESYTDVQNNLNSQSSQQTSNFYAEIGGITNE